MTWEVQRDALKEAVNKLIPDSKGPANLSTPWILVREVKMLEKPKFELGKLMELPGKGSSSGKATGNETGTKVEWADGYETQSKNLFKIQTSNGDTKILFVI